MGSESLQRWSKFEEMAREEDVNLVSFPIQLPPHDFSGYSGYAGLGSQFDFLSQEPSLDAFPLMETFVNDPLYASLHIEPSQCMLKGDSWHGFGSGFRVWNERSPEFVLQNQQLLLAAGSNEQLTAEDVVVEDKFFRLSREEKGSRSKNLSRKTISKYFYMPITQAAKELNVGLTLLKKRCRQLGIHRWPHRKLMSLQTLIKNVQELGKEEGIGAEEKLREAIDILELEKNLLEEIPDMKLEEKTKRLRQACFKANYKKRKLMGMVESRSPSGVNFESAGANPDCGTRF